MLIIQKVLLLPVFYWENTRLKRDGITCQSPGSSEWVFSASLLQEKGILASSLHLEDPVFG